MMTEKDTRPTYKPTSADEALIELIERAHPLTLDTFASAIRYALKYTVANDPQVAPQEDTMDGYTIDSAKLAEIVADFRSHPRGDAGAVASDVRDTLLYDWPQGDEHQDWLDTADVDEIVDWLVSIWFTEPRGENITDQEYQELNDLIAATERVVELYEDNAGGLHMVFEGVQWSGFERIPTQDARFHDDAQAILDGETNEWTMDRTEEPDVDGMELIAVYDEDKPIGLQSEIVGRLGVAGRLYLHID